MNFQGARALTCSTKWEVSSINLPINAFVFTTYLITWGLKQSTIALRKGGKKNVKNY